MAAAFDLMAFGYAHRGLWRQEGPPENSLAAFSAAAKAGLGIEFDLRPSADGEVMVFHDSLLDRMTDASGIFEERPARDLKALTLGTSGERVPSFEDLLALWPAHLPLLCEMKVDGSTDPAALAAAVGARLADWPGRAAAMSFSEEAVRALPAGLMRGQLILPSVQAGEARFDETARRALADGIDYLAVHHTDAARAATALAGTATPFVVWTVRSEADLAAVRPHRPAVIFEHIDPALAAL
jgi:glycerophosphoryl diester phosphodiesterase